MPIVRKGGLDEAYFDISGRVKDFDEAADFAKKLMEEVVDKENLTCSIRVAPNKMLAKIGSDFKKPHVLTVIREKDAGSLLHH